MKDIVENITIKDDKFIVPEGSGLNFRIDWSPNRGRKITPAYLMIHYTQSDSVAGSLAALKYQNKEGQGVSAHLLIGRDGETIQLVHFNRFAYHAGKGFWEGRKLLGYCSIGIEFVNAGPLHLRDGKWMAKFRREVLPEQVVELKHKFSEKVQGWQDYTEEQISVIKRIGKILVDHYDLVDVIGHDDFKPKYKWDPGPAFPMNDVRKKILGDKITRPAICKVIIKTKLREAPSSKAKILAASSLSPGAHVSIIDRKLGWFKVKIEDSKYIGEKIGWLVDENIKRLFPGKLKKNTD